MEMAHFDCVHQQTFLIQCTICFGNSKRYDKVWIQHITISQQLSKNTKKMLITAVFLPL